MKTAIYATLFHSISTDQKPQHFKCLTGKDSWCFFQAVLARGEVPGPHVKHVKTPLKETHLAKSSPAQDDELVILPRVSEFIKPTMLSILLNPVNACLSMFFSARPCASISSGAKGCVESGNVSFKRGRPEEDFCHLLSPSPAPERETYQGQKMKYEYLNIFDSKSAMEAAVAEWFRHRTVACFVTGSSPVPLKTRRVGQQCTLNLSRAETSSRWCGVVVRRGGASSGVVHVT
ncbi:uncharacterized protein TNCV_2056641 [Trichonephila clavipes]|nr:uncharacterized protein TNCV_2056641 [Trichonephila clavipes]